MTVSRHFCELWMCLVVLLYGTYAANQCAGKSKLFTIQLSLGDDITEKLLKDPEIAAYIEKAETKERFDHIQIGLHVNENQVSSVNSSIDAQISLPMQIVVNITNENTSFLVESLRKIWRDEKYPLHIVSSTVSTFSTKENEKIFKFDVITSGDDDATVLHRKLVTVFKNSVDVDHVLFKTNPAPNDWSLWTVSTSRVWYKIFNEKKNYADARVKCEKFGARLAAKTIRLSGDELQNWKKTTLNMGERYWVGLDKLSGEYKWSDGVFYDSDSTPWSDFQPDNLDSEHCGDMWDDFKLRRFEWVWRLNDEKCHKNYRFICESD